MTLRIVICFMLALLTGCYVQFDGPGRFNCDASDVELIGNHLLSSPDTCIHRDRSLPREVRKAMRHLRAIDVVQQIQASFYHPWDSVMVFSRQGWGLEYIIVDFKKEVRVLKGAGLQRLEGRVYYRKRTLPIS